jgi:hypothetical protein
LQELERVSIDVDYHHPLLRLKRALDWEAIQRVMVAAWRKANKNIDGRPGLSWPVSFSATAGPRYLDTGVAPRVLILFRLAHPLSADAQARDKSHLRVYHQHLAVISREPAEWTIEARR